MHLAERHLVVFEFEVGAPLAQDTRQQLVRKFILLGKSIRRDGFEPGKESFRGLMVADNSLK